ncbi:hypothetical protein IAT38_003076 [Cryptococcus sp. DSM 104549]
MATNPRVFFDFAVSDKPLGRVVFELFADVVPKTAENFRALCTGEKGISPISHVPLHYKNSIVHRVIDGFMIQGGDFTKRTGAGGESIYGAPFKDERLEGEGTQVDKKGLLVMANRGPDTNGSQWFVTLAPSPHLTGKHVLFGRVIFGLEHIEAIGKLSTDDRDRPLSPVTIIHCGELELRRPPPAAARPAGSVSASRSPSPKRRKSRKDSDSESSDADSDDSRERRRRRKERKRERKERKEREKSERGEKKAKTPREETVEELDARLEKEEKERLEAKRLAKLAEMKKQLEAERQRIKDSGGVVYKGRGSMRYLDPESLSGARSMPRNFGAPSAAPYGSRQRQLPAHLSNRPDTRGDTRGDRRQDRRQDRGDREQGSQAAKLDRDMDRWQHDRGGYEDERSRFRKGKEGKEESRRSASPEMGRGRSESAEKREASPRLRSESPLRGKTRSPSPARSEESMVLDAED